MKGAKHFTRAPTKFMVSWHHPDSPYNVLKITPCKAGGIMFPIASSRRVRVLFGAVFLFLLALAAVARPAFAQQWERGQWSAPPDLRGLSDTVLAMAFDKNNNLYVGGYFKDAGGVADADNVAMWDGKKWNALGGGFNKSVQAIAVDSRGNVYAGGLFRTSSNGAQKFSHIARWNGTRWDELVYGLDGNVLTLAVDAQDNLYVGGDFKNACRDATCSQSMPAMHIARWTGTQWQAVGSGLDKSVNAIALDARGNVYAGGDFSKTGVATGNLPHIAKWDGKEWSTLGGGVGGSILPTVHAITVDGIGNVYVSGRFALAGKVFASRIAKWDGAQWLPLQQGANFGVYSLITDATGALYIGGLFTRAGFTDASRVAKWNPRTETWLALGGGLDNTVFAFAHSPQQVLFAGGDFLDADGDPNADRIAQWLTKTASNMP